MCNFGGRIMSGYEVIKAQLQMPPPPPHRWHEAKKKLGWVGFKYSRLKWIMKLSTFCRELQEKHQFISWNRAKKSTIIFFKV